MATEDQAQERPSDLKALAVAKFGKETLSDAEKLLLENVPKGKWAKCGPKHDDDRSNNPSNSPLKVDDADSNNNPQEADNWGATRQIRAERVGWLCMDHQEARNRIHCRGIQVYGADITGPLDLSFANIPFALRLRRCRLKAADRAFGGVTGARNLATSVC